MKMNKATKAFMKIAKQENITVDQVKIEIQKVIDMGLSNQDPLVKSRWDSLKIKGRNPTPEEFVLEMTKEIKGKR